MARGAPRRAAPLSVARLARAVGASTSTVHHRFKRATATTPLQFHKRPRLDHARQLMATYDLGAGAAAHAVGYASAAQFSRDYRRAFALPPSRDRARSRAAGAAG
ncbi:MAG TPA: helix-turn-helix domain-containing protein [Kofleriaceae bacterium]|nr:helix-turn-helix domain-containing protein [Kofleriaceae bacterium]